MSAVSINKTESEWRQRLGPEAFDVTRLRKTERAFTGEYWNNREPGIYRCVACGLELFSSEAKFDSGTGWASFYAPMARNHVGLEKDPSFDLERTEVHCARCDAHLGHVFDDGPRPTGLRFSINSAALRFVKKPTQR